MSDQAGDAHDAIQTIAATAEENSAATQEASAASEEMSAEVDEVSARAQQMAATAAQLQTLVGRFSLSRAQEEDRSGESLRRAA
jgi:methyl-accepting chemotaxis protein